MFEVIENLDRAAQVPAYKALVHSSMARTVGSISAHLRQQRVLEQQALEEAGSIGETVDVRNSIDYANEYENTAPYGLDVIPSHYERARNMHSVYSWASMQLEKISQSKWDNPLTLEQMLDYMQNNAGTISNDFAKALADATNIAVEDLKKFNDINERMERERFKLDRPEIVATFEHFDGYGSSLAIDELPPITQFQLAGKVVDGLRKEKGRALTRIMRSKRIDQLADLKLIDDGIEQVKQWANELHVKYRADIDDAVANGANVSDEL